MAMGDIAFLLLIFFVILAKAEDDSHLKWLPADDPTVESVGYSRASVLIDVDQKLYLNGQEIGIASLAKALENVLAGATTQEERKVFLKVHREAIARRFEPVIEAISEAGGQLVHVLEEDKNK